MLEVQKYLQNVPEGKDPLAWLEEEYSIKGTVWEDRLVTLNYSQIDSPKNHQMTLECRSLVLEMNTWKIVSRSFNRFFNVGETQCEPFDITECEALEKVDGSLIGLFEYKGQWLYRTRSMIMPTDIINGNAQGITWKQRIEDDLGVFYATWDSERQFTESVTYIFELICRENRVVTKYNNETGKLVLLAIRDNKTGDYYMGATLDAACLQYRWRGCKSYSFKTIEDCVKAAKELRELQEGYVIAKHGRPVAKQKNPSYVAAHHLRGEGVLTEKRVLDLLIMNETDEYLSIFPEDKGVFDPYIFAYRLMNGRICELVEYVEDTMDMTQKEFALSIKDSPIQSIGFRVRKGVDVNDAWKNLTTNGKYKAILAYKEEDEMENG